MLYNSCLVNLYYICSCPELFLSSVYFLLSFMYPTFLVIFYPPFSTSLHVLNYSTISFPLFFLTPVLSLYQCKYMFSAYSSKIMLRYMLSRPTNSTNQTSTKLGRAKWWNCVRHKSLAREKSKSTCRTTTLGQSLQLVTRKRVRTSQGHLFRVFPVKMTHPPIKLL